MLETEEWVMIQDMNKQKREPTYKTRPSKPSKLDPYKDFLKKEMEKEEPISAVHLFEEIQKKGYTGGLTILKDFIRPLKAKKAVHAVYRFETKPGKVSLRRRR